jgi:branched-chain amino acid transport system ATP-binding protein
MRLEVRDLWAGYGRTEVLRGVSIEARAGEIVAIIGPNGAGKSTVLRAVYNQCEVRRGEIVLDGAPLGRTPAHRLVRLGVAAVPQGRTVFPSLTVAENLDLGVYHEGGRPGGDRLAEVLARFPVLGERLRQRAGTLSGGERQMLAMARALVAEPDLLLLDEPSAGLSPLFMDAIFDKIREINEAGVPILMVEQNARRALALAHRGYVLDTGRNAIEGTGADLLRDPQVAELYLGGSGITASSSTSTSTPSGMKPDTK